MKTLFLIATCIALSTVSCNNKNEEHSHPHSDETHQHDDAAASEAQSNHSEQIEFDASAEDSQDSITHKHGDSTATHKH